MKVGSKIFCFIEYVVGWKVVVGPFSWRRNVAIDLAGKRKMIT